MHVSCMLSKHHPPRLSVSSLSLTHQPSPVIGRVGVDPDFVPGEVAVSEEEDGAARPDAHRVHVVPVGPVGGEPPEPQLALRDDQPPPPGTVVAVVADSTGRPGNWAAALTGSLVYHLWHRLQHRAHNSRSVLLSPPSQN